MQICPQLDWEPDLIRDESGGLAVAPIVQFYRLGV